MGDPVVGGLSVVLAYRFGRTTRDIPLAIPFSIIFAATPRPRHRSDPADRGSAPGEELVGRIPRFGFRHGFLFVVLLLRSCCSLGVGGIHRVQNPQDRSLAPCRLHADILTGVHPCQAKLGPESP